MYFDNIISLGYKCETSYAFQAIFGLYKSNLLNWVHVTEISNLLRFLENPDLLLSKGLTHNGYLMYEDNELKFSFHSKIKDRNKILKENGEIDEKLVEEDIKEVTSRVTYLKKKFLDMLPPPLQRTCLLCALKRIFLLMKQSNI